MTEHHEVASGHHPLFLRTGLSTIQQWNVMSQLERPYDRVGHQLSEMRKCAKKLVNLE